jgi:hypothetical protein
MRTVKRALLVASTLLAAGLYVYVAAVRAVPGVKRRKAALRARAAAPPRAPH